MLETVIRGRRARFISVATLAFSSLSMFLVSTSALAAPDSASAVSPSAASKIEPLSKSISIQLLEKYQPITVSVEESGKEVKYMGVPLRALLAEMLPDVKIDLMPEWKALNRQELVMEVFGKDGYVGIVTATDMAINKTGDRFLLATRKDGKAIESGVQLICKMDEARVRWIRSVVLLRLVSVAARKS